MPKTYDKIIFCLIAEQMLAYIFIYKYINIYIYIYIYINIYIYIYIFIFQYNECYQRQLPNNRRFIITL